MNNLRERQPYRTQDFTIARGGRQYANAVIRAFGNSKAFPYGTCTRDLSLADGLEDCSLLFLQVEDDKVIDVINSFTYEELVFTRMTGETGVKSPTTCLISKYDILTAYENYEKSKNHK